MGALGDFNSLINSFKKKGKFDEEQTRVLGQYDKYYDDFEKEIDSLKPLTAKEHNLTKEDYKKLYDLIQNHTDKKLENFDKLYDSFNKGITETSLTADELYKWGRELSDFAPRVPGTYSMDKTNDYIEEKLQSFGIKTWKEPINFNGVFFHEWSFEITTPVGKKYISFPENNVGFGDVTADIVDIGRGFEEDYKNLKEDVKGKIALINLGTIPEHEGPCAERERYTILHLYDLAYAHGVAGLIGYFTDTPGNTIKLLEPGIKPIGGSNVWGPAEVGENHEFTIPVLNIGRPDAEEIKSFLAKGKVEGHLVIKGVRKVSTTNIVLGLLPGVEDRTLAVAAHSCTAFEGAVCDTIGVVGALGIAKHFSEIPVEQRKKSILFFFDSFHVWGNCCQTAISVIDRNKTLTDKLDALIWLDHIGDGKADSFKETAVSDNAVVWPLTALTQLKYKIPPVVLPKAQIWAVCVTGAFQRLGIPTITMQDMNDFTLTPEDTWDKFEPEVVYRDVLTHVDLTQGLLNLEVPRDTSAEPFGGCGTLFTDLSEPKYKEGEHYVPEKDYPLYIGGANGPIEIRYK